MQHQIDALGMRCPRPIVELAKTRRRAQPGDLIEITADDRAFDSDVVAWCETTGCELIELSHDQGHAIALIRLLGANS